MKCLNAKDFTIFSTTTTTTHQQQQNMFIKKVSYFGNKIDLKTCIVLGLFKYYYFFLGGGGKQQPSFSEEKKLSLEIQNVDKLVTQ